MITSKQAPVMATYPMGGGDLSLSPASGADIAARNAKLTRLIWGIFIVYAVVSTVMTVVAPLYQVMSLMVAAVAIAFIHGSMRYGWKGILTLFLVANGVGFTMENLSVATGFPFGWYHYTNQFKMPMIGQVPLDVGTLYFAMGYNGWVIANVLLDHADVRLESKFHRFALPAVAAFVMTMWDVVLDPTVSTVRNVWIWRDGGGYFGVPLTNYYGWYFVVFAFFLLFTLYLAARAKRAGWRPSGLSKNYWALPIVLYQSVAVGWIISFYLTTNVDVKDAAGHAWRSKDLAESAAITAIFTMGFVTILALLRLFQPAKQA